jgi:Flp pilus assembly protein TadG
VSGARGRGQPRLGRGRQGSALVEVLLVVPVLMLILFGLIGVGRVTQARAAVAAVGRECARAAAGSWTRGEAAANGAYRAGEVAAGYGLTNGTLTTRLDLGGFRAGETVACGVGYTVELDDLPLLGWGRVDLASTGQERIAPYRGDRPGPSR